MIRVFVSVVGQDDNLGDSVLRRGLINAIRNSDTELHVFIGSNSLSYQSALGLRPEDVLYASRPRWLRSLLLWSLVSKTAVALNAGESQLAHGSTYLGKKMTLVLRIVRLCGARVLHTGVGIRNPHGAPLKSVPSSLRQCDLVSWRDQVSRDFVGLGIISPDWAFFATDIASPIEPSENRRDQLIISMRGDRPKPPEKWFAAVRNFAAVEGLSIAVVTQVARDEIRSSEIATAFGIDTHSVISWTQGSHADQEAIIRNVYRQSVAIISDRLHALVIGATEGALPIGFTIDSAEKVSRTLSAAGYSESSLSVGGVSTDEATRWMLSRIKHCNSAQSIAYTANKVLANLSQEMTLAVAR